MIAQKQIKKYWLIILIILLAASLRFFRIEALTTFSGDQGYDFLIVKRMIVDGKFTLLGPKIGPYNELGNLYLGPAYYYLIAPSLYFFKLNPLGPAIFTSLLSTLTVILIYVIGLNFFSKQTGILAGAFFAFNSLIINQSRASSNPHLMPFFATVLFFSTLQIVVKNSKNLIWPVSTGVSMAIIFQLHYMGVSVILASILFLLYGKKLKEFLIVLLSFISGISPQIFFELRHEFFITNEIIKQLSYGSLLAKASITQNISSSIRILSETFFSNASLLIPVLLLVPVIFLAGKNFNQKRVVYLFLISTIFFTIVAGSIFPGSLNSHYFTAIYPSLCLLISAIFVKSIETFKSWLARLAILLFVATVLYFNISNLNLFRDNGYTMPIGWNLKGIQMAAQLIVKDPDSSKKFNIASTLDGDTRSMPYRYLTEIKGKIPLDVEKYPESDVIYLISRDEQGTIANYSVWEVASYRPFEIYKIAEIQNGIKLYKLKHKEAGF